MDQDQKQREENPETETETAEQAVEDKEQSKEELLTEVARLQGEVQDLQSRLLRSSADFDNFRKRTRQEKEELGKYATTKLLQEVLPVLDNFQLALSVETTDATALKQGVEMVFRQLQAALEKEGVKEMEAVGQPFDPNIHEAVLQVESSEYDSGIVVEELRKGYLLHDRVIRPAMVKVSQ